MNKYVTAIFRFFRKIKSFFPSRLPVGMTEFNAWAKDIQELYDLPDHVATTWALSSMIVSLPPTKSGWSQFYKSKRYFGVCALKSMSNQIAAAVMQDLKDQQAAAQKKAQEDAAAAALASKPEATTSTEVASNVVSIQN